MPESKITNEQVRDKAAEIVRAGNTLDQVELADGMRERVTQLLIETLGQKALDELKGSWKKFYDREALVAEALRR